VCTAKAFTGLRAAVADGEIQPGQRTVFLHTGGLLGPGAGFAGLLMSGGGVESDEVLIALR
jgi:hypothetical protein